ncbi:uncharacterized protein CCR75_006076 [Bremia lactucae]|uniref:NUC153 domain-containing protein n=1 Tax=Bremia lactucae TaxID=4779 RepID=A0A976ICG9_BRELC|nr:hypothetical protein CCR75_006076 [Bremia lactucae]
MSDPVSDARFGKVHNDPRFARKSNRKSKLEIDKRFAAALKDKRFQSVQGKYDKYGRRITKKDNELDKFYRLEEEEGEEDTTKAKAKAKAPFTTSSDDDNDDACSAAVTKSDQKFSRLDYLNRMARGKLESGSGSSDSDSEDSDIEETQIEEEEAEDIPLGTETRRFAVLHCDWTRIRAVDLFALCQSFAPATGTVQNVTIYPSDFGLQKMVHPNKEEEQHGPRGIWDDKLKKREILSEMGTLEMGNEDKNDSIGTINNIEINVSDIDDEKNYDSDDPLGVKTSVTLEKESNGFDSEKLRKYELQKLRYYYAVVSCDSVKTASAIFDQCDQLEYETSSNVLDLRYVPDDTTFTNASKESCDSLPDHYKPALFATLALQQTDVKLTWEEDDDQRLELLTRPADWKDAHDDDFKAYLASEGSDGSESDTDCDGSNDEGGSKSKVDTAEFHGKKKSKKKAKIKKLRNRYRSMLLSSDAEDEVEATLSEGGLKASSEEEGNDLADGDMEMSFTPGAGDILKAKRQKELEATETPFERYTRERKQEKNRKLHEKRERQKQLEREQREILQKKGRGAKEANFLREAINGGGADSEAEGSDNDHEKRNFDMNKIAKQEKFKSLKGKRRVNEMKKLATQKVSGGLQESFKFDAADPRFQGLYAKSSRFQLDPTDSKFKKTEATQAILKERRQRFSQNAASMGTGVATESNSSANESKHTLNIMVESLKRKSQQHSEKKSKKSKTLVVQKS